jgi:hypothetical protein
MWNATAEVAAVRTNRIDPIRDDDAAKLVQFYRGELDELKC